MKKSKYSGMFGDYSSYSDEMDELALAEQEAEQEAEAEAPEDESAGADDK